MQHSQFECRPYSTTTKSPTCLDGKSTSRSLSYPKNKTYDSVQIKFFELDVVEDFLRYCAIDNHHATYPTIASGSKLK